MEPCDGGGWMHSFTLKFLSKIKVKVMACAEVAEPLRS